MQALPAFLGACALVSIAGAVSGAAIDTQPIEKAGVGLADIPRTHLAQFAGYSPEAPQPDHYDLVTPEGRVEVAALSDRGLYAQPRFHWREADFAPPPPPPVEYRDPAPIDTYAANRAEAAPADDDPTLAYRTPGLAAPDAPNWPRAAPAAPPAPPADGQAKVIDVSATLAVR